MVSIYLICVTHGKLSLAQTSVCNAITHFFFVRQMLRIYVNEMMGNYSLLLIFGSTFT